MVRILRGNSQTGDLATGRRSLKTEIFGQRASFGGHPDFPLRQTRAIGIPLRKIGMSLPCFSMQ